MTIQKNPKHDRPRHQGPPSLRSLWYRCAHLVALNDIHAILPIHVQAWLAKFGNGLGLPRAMATVLTPKGTLTEECNLYELAHWEMTYGAKRSQTTGRHAFLRGEARTAGNTVHVGVHAVNSISSLGTKSLPIKATGTGIPAHLIQENHPKEENPR